MKPSIYNLTEYLELEAFREHATPKNYKVTSEDNFFEINYLERDNPKDIISPYGYAGYTHQGNQEWLETAIAQFKNHLQNQGVISALIRNKLSSTSTPNSIECVYINLQADIDIQINTNLKRKLKKLKAKNLAISFGAVMPAQFKQLYNQTMNRQQAKKFYYFGFEYFKKLARIPGVFQTNVFDLDTSTIICSGIFFEEGEYHLGATLSNYVPMSPSSLMIYETAKYFQNNLRTSKLNLGGGNEKLLQFKKSFSKSVQYFTTHQWIINSESYEALTYQRNLINQGTANLFPEYRN